MQPVLTNTLYYGDNLDILRQTAYFPSNFVDLIYLDPPFNSQRTYNVLFKDEHGHDSEAQIVAFEDTWHWNAASEETFAELVINNPGAICTMVQALRHLVGTNQMMAYLVMMTARLIELHRVLKPTGSLYLHCDPTASHYLKVILDTIFGPKQFLNEITWKRSSAHSDTKQGMRRCGRISDIILVYAKTDAYTWNPVYMPYTQEYLEQEYRHKTPQGRFYKETDLTAAKPGGDTSYEWRVKRPVGLSQRWQADMDQEHLTPKAGWEYQGVLPYQGRYWAYSRENILQFVREGRIIHRETGMPRLMHFADEMPGITLQDLWTDIPPVTGNQDLGYPTQKPLALLERIITASSNPGDIVLDPFCGCGTTIAAAEKIGRRWLGIDITHLAIALQTYRLESMFPGVKISVIGEPKDIGAAQQLASEDRYQFQWWALSLVRAKPLGGEAGSKSGKKGRDRGIDGAISFIDDAGKHPKQVIVQVKSGKVSSRDIRDLVGTVQREQAAIGVFITLERPTRDMDTEAIQAGFYESPGWQKRYPRIQILTIEDLLRGAGVNMPPQHGTFKQAQRVEAPKGEQQYLPLEEF